MSLMLSLLLLPAMPQAAVLHRFPGHRLQVHDNPTAHPNVNNCTWLYYTQKLDHFGDSAVANLTFQQRYCLYTDFWGGEATDPVFFYTGNESPLDEYVNNTGLMWNLGKDMKALLVFAEHRYEGKSVPDFEGVTNCLSYVTTAQALEDYRVLVGYIKGKYQIQKAPVVVFGGSYGGMLSGWMRIKYPEVVTGAIAASAPVLWTPQLGTEGVAASAVALSRGLGPIGGATQQCYNNLRSAWPILSEVMKTELGQQLVSSAAKQCKTVNADTLLQWGQAPWFAMAEGDYPFPSIYITYSLGGNFPLPAWPMRVACNKGLGADFGITLQGSAENVMYNLTMGEIKVEVDWDKLSGNGEQLTREQIERSGVLRLAAAVADAAGVWYNITKNVSCYHMDSLEARVLQPHQQQPAGRASAAPTCDCPACDSCTLECPLCHRQAPRKCTHKNGPVSRGFSWGPICCNEALNNICYAVQGVGGDIFWPPNQPRGYTLEDVAGPWGYQPGSCSSSFDAQGLFGAPTVSDGYSMWLGEYYDTNSTAKYTNIVWSNGQLDPWSGGGVYPAGGSVLGPMVQNLTEDGSSISLAIPLGGHHLDLFFPTAADPQSVKEARNVEKQMIIQWISEHNRKLAQPSE